MDQSQDSLTDWMNTAGRVPLLPKHEVLRIAKRIQALEEGSTQRQRLVSKLVLHNMRLVISFVYKFMRAKSAHKWGSVETMDYLQTGLLGLYRAAEKFDPDRGYTFATYATHWIRSTVGRYNLKASSPFKISEEACRCAYSYERYGKISEKAHVSAYCRENPEEMINVLRAAQSPISLQVEMESGNMLIDHLTISANEPVVFYEDSFDPEVERILIEAKLTELEDAIIRGIFLSGYQKDQICKAQQITSKQFLKAKGKAISKLRKVATPDILGM